MIGSLVPWYATCSTETVLLARRYKRHEVQAGRCTLGWLQPGPGMKLPSEVVVSTDLTGDSVFVRFGSGYLHRIGATGACTCGERCLQRRFVAVAAALGLPVFQPTPFDVAYTLKVQGDGARLDCREWPGPAAEPAGAAALATQPRVIEVGRMPAGMAKLTITAGYPGDPLGDPIQLDLGRAAPCPCGRPGCWHRRLLTWLAETAGFDAFSPLDPGAYRAASSVRGDLVLIERNEQMPTIGVPGVPVSALLRRAVDGTTVQVRESRAAVDRTNADSAAVELRPGAPCPCGVTPCLHQTLLMTALAAGWEPWRPSQFPRQGTIWERPKVTLVGPDGRVTERVDHRYGLFLLLRTAAGNAVFVRERQSRDWQFHRVTRDGRCTCSAGTGWDDCPHRATASQCVWDPWQPRQTVWEPAPLAPNIYPAGHWLFDADRQIGRAYGEVADGWLEVTVQPGQPRRVRRIRTGLIDRDHDHDTVVVLEAEPSALDPAAVVPAAELDLFDRLATLPEALTAIAVRRREPWCWHLVRLVDPTMPVGADGSAGGRLPSGS